MICQKEFTITVQTAVSAQAWWTMDLGIATSETDSVSALGLNVLAGAGFMSSVAGKVGNALQYAANFGNSCVSRCANAALLSSGNGFTLVGWMNVTNVLPDASSSTAFSYQFNQGGPTYSFNILLNPVANTWGIEWGLGPTATAISLGAALGWHFFAATMNLVTGAIILKIDQAGSSADTVAAPAPGAHTTGTILTSAAAAGFIPGSTNTSLFDEMALYNSVLTNAQLDYLYNAGTGRTYPP